MFDGMVYPGPKFLILKTKKDLIFSEVRGWFFILCYHGRLLQQIHWNENFCRMYGLALIVSLARLNICWILTRYVGGGFPKKWISVYLISAMCMIPFLMPYLNKKSRYWFGRKKCPCPAQLTKEEINQVIITLRPISLWSQNRLTRR